MFIESLFHNPHFFVYVVVTVVLSITLHELAHGWVATWQGDPTPRNLGHLTINPMVHMGGTSLVMLVLLGMAFGAMPVDPTRFRSRYGDAMVAAAGPLMNLVLAGIALTALGLWIEIDGVADPDWEGVKRNAQEFLSLFGFVNITLFLLNLIPVPPLDGSSILASFHTGYARLIRSIQNPQIWFLGLFVVLLLLGRSGYGLFGMGRSLGHSYLELVFGR